MSTAAMTPPTPPRQPLDSHLRDVSPLPPMDRLTNHTTSVPPSLSTTPTSTASASITSSPLRSPQPSVNISSKPSPDSLIGREHPFAASTGTVQLPDPLLPNISQSAMSEALNANKGHGLIRRLSRGAAQKLTRRRTSSSNANGPGHSSGPIIRRHRSDSKSCIESGQEALDFDQDDDVDERSGEISKLASDTPRNTADRSSRPAQEPSEEVLAPVIPALLQQGTFLTKITKKKKKQLKFVLDSDSAKVYWDPAKPWKRVYIDDIQDIRTGEDAKNYRDELQIGSDVADRWITILYSDRERSKGRAFKTMHLIAPDKHIFQLWTTTLEAISTARTEMMAGLAGHSGAEKHLKAQWRNEMAKKFRDQPHAEADETMDLQGVENLCKSLHINTSRDLLAAQFTKADVRRAGSLTYNEFVDFVLHLKERKDIRVVYEQLASDPRRGLSRSEFLRFLKEVQHIEVDRQLQHWNSVFDKFTRQSLLKESVSETPVGSTPLCMDFGSLATFLTSPDNAVLEGPSREKVILDRPLNEYFISSSHNTYLLGRQVAGESSTQGYIRALQRGCRCVEVDCWDGADGRPIVYHGRTLTTKILFSDCIYTISKYAFVSSPYPLTISLEVHCNAEQQNAMAEILKQTLGDRMVTQALMTNTLTLPSPEDLKGRILVKVKTGHVEETNGLSSDSIVTRPRRSFSSPFSKPVAMDNSLVNAEPLSSSPSTWAASERSSVSIPTKASITGGTAASTSSTTDDSDAYQGQATVEKRQESGQRRKIVKALGDLAVYTKGQKYAGFTSPASKTYNHIFSFAERTFDNLCRDHDTKALLDKHNMRYLMRVYPSAWRVNSSNFDPNKFWRRGVQMVALNWQTYDLGTQLNEAMFAAGIDRTGYVLKPKELRQAKHLMDIESETTKLKKEKMLVKFSIEMISAQQLPRSHILNQEEDINPYVEFEVFCADDKAKGVASGEGGLDASARNGVSGIGFPHRRRSKIIQGNAFNPIFNDTFKMSLETKFPSLVFVRWTVRNSADGRTYDNRNPRLATFTAKYQSLQEGYRPLPLFDHNGEQYLFSTLFCKISKETPISVEREESRSGKVETLKQLGRSVFNRGNASDRKPSLEEQ